MHNSQYEQSWQNDVEINLKRLGGYGALYLIIILFAAHWNDLNSIKICPTIVQY